MKSVNTNDDRFLALLKRWISGEIKHPEESELGRLAADDDFRRAAWEGLQVLPEADHEAHLHKLEAWIQQKKRNKRRTIWIPVLAIAASLALILAAVWFMPAGIEDGVSAKRMESGQSAESVQPAAEMPPPGQGDREPIAALQTPAPEPARPNIRPRPAQSPTPAGTEPELPWKEEEADNSLVVEAIRDEPELNAGQSMAAAEEAVSYSAPPVQDAMAKKSQAPAGSAPSRAASGAPAARKPVPDNHAVVPEGGWDVFNQYLNATARLTEAARNNNVTGYVQVQFELDSMGQATAFKVLKSLGFGCDEEAVRLIREKKWTGTPAQPVRVDVWFRR